MEEYDLVLEDDQEGTRIDLWSLNHWNPWSSEITWEFGEWISMSICVSRGVWGENGEIVFDSDTFLSVVKKVDAFWMNLLIWDVEDEANKSVEMEAEPVVKLTEEEKKVR